MQEKEIEVDMEDRKRMWVTRIGKARKNNVEIRVREESQKKIKKTA